MQTLVTCSECERVAMAVERRARSRLAWGRHGRLHQLDFGRLTLVVLLLPSATFFAIVWLSAGQMSVDLQGAWRATLTLACCLVIQLLLLLGVEATRHPIATNVALVAAAFEAHLLSATATATGGYYALFYAFILLVAGLKLGQLWLVVHLMVVSLVHTVGGYIRLPIYFGLPAREAQLGLSALAPAATLYLLVLAVYASRVVRRFRYLETLLQNVSDGVFVLDERGRVLELNAEAARQLGRREQEVLGRGIEEFCRLQGGQDMGEWLERCVREGSVRFELDWIRPDGDALPAEIAACRVPGLEPVQIEAFSRDMSRWKALTAAIERQNEELRRVNEELERSRDMALEASRLKSRFLATMSHELRTPLNSIIGYTRLLLQSEPSLSTQARDDLSRVLRAAEHLLELINGLLDIARIEAGRETVEIGRTELDRVVRSAVESVLPMAREKGVAVRIQEECEYPTILTDERKLWQILVNLLSNAVRFTDDGEVRVYTERAEPDYLAVCVADTGIGIPPEDLPHIFDEFRQVKNRHRQTGTGTGLGLAITRRLVELLGGKIEASSEVGKGSTFRVLLPVNVMAAHDGGQAQAELGGEAKVGRSGQ